MVFQQYSSMNEKLSQTQYRYGSFLNFLQISFAIYPPLLPIESCLNYWTVFFCILVLLFNQKQNSINYVDKCFTFLFLRICKFFKLTIFVVRFQFIIFHTWSLESNYSGFIPHVSKTLRQSFILRT